LISFCLIDPVKLQVILTLPNFLQKYFKIIYLDISNPFISFAGMKTLNDYNKAFEQAKNRLMKRTTGYTDLDKAILANEMGVSQMTIRNYCAGQGTNLKTYLTILDYLNKNSCVESVK